MTIANAIEGGLAGATTLTLLEEALHKIDPKAPRTSLNKTGIIKKLKKGSRKKGVKATKLYIALAVELLTSASYFGLTALGKKKNAVLRGSLLGAAAGLGTAFLTSDDDKEDPTKDKDSFSKSSDAQKKMLTIALYTAGGMLAGLAIKRINTKKSKKNKKKK